jgi:dihydroneopterin aldolase/2-amino-4-hydroxy-6-hydroxymethyldihydropteridine diphosphokinase
MTDLIFVTNLVLHATHGVLPEETRLGQRFYIDIECATDVAPAAAGDDVTKTINYADLCDLAAEVSAEGPFRLIETLAERLALRILARFPAAARTTVRVRKPQAPIAAALDHVGVEVTRFRRNRVAFSLGSNIGDKAANIRAALTHIHADPGLEIEQVSHLYQTAPWGKEDQDWFLNACAVGTTSLSPTEALRLAKRTEVLVGRVPGERWGPRMIDIDILYLGDAPYHGPDLTLPHRDLFNRAFVLIPLAEIAADEVVGGLRIGDAADKVERSPDDVKRLDG